VICAGGLELDVGKQIRQAVTTLPIARTRAARFLKSFLALSVALWALAAIQAGAAQESRKPLTEKEVIDLLTNDVPPARVSALATEFGISFQMTSSTEQSLRDAGASENLMETLRKLAPKPAPSESKAPANPPAAAPPAAAIPPVLWIESSPGDAQVYIDDEPVGTTSPEGRLKLTRLGAGEHRVRVAHAGYRDFEQTVSLTSGSATVTASLQQAAAANPPASPPANPTPQSEANSTAAAVLGMTVRAPPAGVQGAVVLGLVPGGPAEQAGLRPGFTVLSIAGRSVSTLQDVHQATLGRSPGEVVPVTFSTGSNVRTVQVPLANASIFANVPHFFVMHDHGPPAPNYCVGWMYVFDGLITYVGRVGVNSAGRNGPKHTFEFPMSDIKEVKKNSFYMAALGGFHIRLKDGAVNNFVALNSQGHVQPPNEILAAVETATARF
jgi:PEGA domain/PDZ domain